MIQTDLRPHRADLALHLGILSIVMPVLPFGAFACWIATRDLSAIRMGRVDPAGSGALKAARILGIAGSLASFALLLGLVTLALAAFAAWTGARTIL